MKLLGDVMLILIVIVGVLVGVAFLTLFERSILGYIQCRSGPSSVGFSGFIQPFADALSLFGKEQISVVGSNYLLYLVVPGGGLMLTLMMWMLFPLVESLMDFSLGMIFFLCCSSLGVYFIMLGGWGSNSKYGLLGAYRAVAQTISYEVSMALILLMVVVYSWGYDFWIFSFKIWFCLGWLWVFIMWVVTCLAELNRTPFDFAEGESELVSGFNVEYAGGLFALIFISEYSNMFLLGLVSVMGFMNGGLIVGKLLILVVYFLWVRGTVVRYRYDSLMMLVWKSFLFGILGFLLVGIGIQVMWWVIM